MSTIYDSFIETYTVTISSPNEVIFVFPTDAAIKLWLDDGAYGTQAPLFGGGVFQARTGFYTCNWRAQFPMPVDGMLTVHMRVHDTPRLHLVTGVAYQAWAFLTAF